MDGLWAVYTTHYHKYFGDTYEEREAVGIVSGGVPIDGGEGIKTTHRESAFPFGLIKQALTVKVETAKASEEDDRIHILHSIRGNDGDGLYDTPPTSDVKYNEVNEAVQAGFISTVGSIKAAVKEDGDI